MSSVEVMTIKSVVGLLLHLSNGQMIIIDKDKFPRDRKWICVPSSEAFEVMVTPIGPNQVNIGIKKFSDNPFSPYEVEINADQIIFIHKLTKESDLGKAFIKSKSGIIVP